MKLRYFIAILLTSLILVINGCDHESNKPKPGILKVGTITGPETELMLTAKKVAKQQGVEIEVVEFYDYALPNSALNDGSIDANMFQHKPYLDATNKAKGYHLVAIGKTFVYPMAIYSKKIKNFSELTEKALIGIPNDPSNEARALLLLQKAGLITLKDPHSLTATKHDVASNPKHLRLEEIDAAQLPRTLDDMAMAVVNSNYAIPNGFSPTKDGLIVEDTNSPYVNLIVVREDELQRPELKVLVASLQSPEVKQRAKELFGDGAVAAW